MIDAIALRALRTAFPLPTLDRLLAAITARRDVRERRRARRAALQHLSDHQLRDIGLTRGDAQAIAAGLHGPGRTPVTAAE